MQKIPRQAYTTQFKELAVKWVPDGESASTVVKELGLSDQTVRNWIKAAAQGKLKGAGGKPAFVVIPYDDYNVLMQNKSMNLEHVVPGAVVDLIFDKGCTPARAWREHLDKTQEDVAHAMGISQAAYSRLEKSAKPRKATRLNIAQALGITIEQLDI